MQGTIAPSLDLPLKRWSVNEYHRIIAAGILQPSDAIELIAGQIILRPAQDPPHAANTSSFSNELVILFAGKAWVRTQLPATLSDDSEPEPDVAIVQIDEHRYRDQHPQTSDILLVIEVANTTLNTDRNTKAKIYAQSGVIEYWIVDTQRKQLMVLREPQDDQYSSETVLGVGDTIVPVSFPEITIGLRDVLV